MKSIKNFFGAFAAFYRSASLGGVIRVTRLRLRIVALWPAAADLLDVKAHVTHLGVVELFFIPSPVLGPHVEFPLMGHPLVVELLFLLLLLLEEFNVPLLLARPG